MAENEAYRSGNTKVSLIREMHGEQKRNLKETFGAQEG